MTKRTLFIIIGLIVVVVVGLLLLSTTGDKSGPLMLRMSLREKVTMDIVKDGQKNIINDDLVKINSELSIILSGHSTKLDAAFKKNKMPTAKKAGIEDPETSKPILSKLNTAKLNARYDEIYRTTLKLQLQSLNQLGQELYGKTKSTSLKKALSDQYTDVAKYIKQLDALKQS